MLDHDRAVKLIKACKGAYGLTDADLARESGQRRGVINLYLNRKIDQLQQDAERLLRVLELQEFLPGLTVPSDRIAREMQLDKVLRAESEAG